MYNISAVFYPSSNVTNPEATYNINDQLFKSPHHQLNWWLLTRPTFKSGLNKKNGILEREKEKKRELLHNKNP